MQTLNNHINEVEDPRRGNVSRHNFCDLMTICLLCAICGGETAVDMEIFCKSKGNYSFMDTPVLSGFR